MTIIATGGFSTKNMSIGFFDSISTEIVVMVYVNFSLRFILIFQSVRKASSEVFKNSQVQFFLFFVGIVTFIVMLWLKKHYRKLIIYNH